MSSVYAIKLGENIMKIHELKQSHLMETYLLMMFVVLLPVVLNFYAPTLMGRGLRNSIITANVLIFGVWFFLLLFFGRSASCDYKRPYVAIKEI